MSFLRRLFSFSIIQLLIELLLIGIIVVITSLLVPTIHLPQLALQFIVEGSLVVGVAATFLLARLWIERRPFADLGLSRRHIVRDLLFGFLLGFLLQGTTIGILALAGW